MNGTPAAKTSGPHDQELFGNRSLCGASTTFGRPNRDLCLRGARAPKKRFVFPPDDSRARAYRPERAREPFPAGKTGRFEMAASEPGLGRGVSSVSDSGSGSRQASGNCAPVHAATVSRYGRVVCASTRLVLARSLGLAVTGLNPPGEDGRVNWKIDRLVAPGDGRLVRAASSDALTGAFGFRAMLDIAIALSGPIGLEWCGVGDYATAADREIDDDRIREVLHEWGEAESVPSAPLQAASRLVDEFLASEDAYEGILGCAAAALFEIGTDELDIGEFDALSYVIPGWDGQEWADEFVSITLDTPYWRAECPNCNQPLSIAVLAPATERLTEVGAGTGGIDMSCARCD